MTCIALLTDFGTSDIYVGAMKGVMHGIVPDAILIDITHAIQPQNVQQGAFALLNSYRHFPARTVFLVVVDPGVGSTRKPIAVQTKDYGFIAPDNGVLSYVLSELGHYGAVSLDNERYYHRGTLSQTFHGRDIFAPGAAYLARGDVPLADFGETLETLIMLPEPRLRMTENTIEGDVIHIDHFGNIITSIGVFAWGQDSELHLNPRFGQVDKPPMITADAVKTSLNGITLTGISRAYHTVERGNLLVQIDSNGYLEIAVNHGNAAQRLQTAIGDSVKVEF